MNTPSETRPELQEYLMLLTKSRDVWQKIYDNLSGDCDEELHAKLLADAHQVDEIIKRIPLTWNLLRKAA